MRVLVGDVERVAVVVARVVRVAARGSIAFGISRLLTMSSVGDVRGLGERRIDRVLVAVAPVVADVVGHESCTSRADAGRGRRRRSPASGWPRSRPRPARRRPSPAVRSRRPPARPGRRRGAPSRAQAPGAPARSSACRPCCGSASRTAGRRPWRRASSEPTTTSTTPGACFAASVRIARMRGVARAASARTRRTSGRAAPRRRCSGRRR